MLSDAVRISGDKGCALDVDDVLVAAQSRLQRHRVGKANTGLQRQVLKRAKGFMCKNMISQFQGRAARGGRCHARMQLLVVQAAFGKQENSFQSEGLPVYL